MVSVETLTLQCGMCPYYRGVLIERYHTIEYKGTYCRVILYQVIVSIIEYYSYTVDVHM